MQTTKLVAVMIAGLFLAFPGMLVNSFGSPAPCQATDCLVPSNWSCAGLGAYPGVRITYTINKTLPNPDYIVPVFVYAVVHNSINQTVYYSTATIVFSYTRESLLAFLVIVGLPQSAYAITLFATDFSGNAVSHTTRTTCSF